MTSQNKEIVKRNAPIICTAVICITIIEIVALLKGIDGKVLTLCVAAITGIVGYKFGDIKAIIRKLVS